MMCSLSRFAPPSPQQTKPTPTTLYPQGKKNVHPRSSRPERIFAESIIRGVFPHGVIHHAIHGIFLRENSSPDIRGLRCRCSAHSINRPLPELTTTLYPRNQGAGQMAETSRFPLTRMAIARVFANLTVCALPLSERACLEKAINLADHLYARAYTIKEKGQSWRSSDGDE